MISPALAIRKAFELGDREKLAGLKIPEDVEGFYNIAYDRDMVWQILDVYRPKAGKGKALPVIINVHGGGWVYGDKEVYRFYCADLAKRGFAVISYTYRLAPEFKYPAPFEDLNSVLNWMYANAGRYLFDTGNVFAVGDSAGAHILGLFTALCADPDHGKNVDFKVPDQMPFKAVALNCGAYHIETEDTKDLQNRVLMEAFMPDKGTLKELEKINVLGHAGEGFPPSFVMTAQGDFLKDQAPLMAEVLEKHHVPCRFKIYGDEKNPLGHVFHCNVKLKEAAVCNDEETAFFREYIR